MMRASDDVSTFALLRFYSAILRKLEAQFGKQTGPTWLSLPDEWKGKGTNAVQRWMAENGHPFDPSGPSLLQLEQVLEREAKDKAKALVAEALSR